MIRRTIYEQPADIFPLQQSDTDSWEYHYYKIMAGLEGSEEQKESVIRKRILKYFGEFKFDAQSYFSIRSDIDYATPGLQIIPSAIIIYGIDYMAIDKAKSYFKGFVMKVRRVDDSHFVINFRTQEDCLSALNKCKLRKGQMFKSPQHVFEASNEGWIEMVPYQQFIFERKLMARYLTTVDKIDNICMSTKQSCAFAYSEAKRRFMKSLKEELDLDEKKRSDRNKIHKKPGVSLKVNGMHCGFERSREKESYERESKWSTAFQNLRCCCVKNKYRQNDSCKCKRYMKTRSCCQSDEEVIDSKLFEQYQMRQSDLKFEQYIKKRNKNIETKSKPISTLSVNTPSYLVSILGKECKQSITSTNFPNEMFTLQGKVNHLNENEVDFSTFLEKLKLDDTKENYSQFDLEEINM